MLQPLAIAIVCGLSFSMVVSLILIPTIYSLIGRRETTLEKSSSATLLTQPESAAHEGG